MHSTDANGHTLIYMPRDRTKAVEQLAGLGAILASREWERAALVALLVQNKGRGRPKSGMKFDKYSITDFARIGVYGFRSPSTISAYLKIWEMTGLPAPNPGDKVTLPLQDFPDMGEIYGREPEIEDDDVEEEFDPEDEEQEAEPQPRPRPKPTPNKNKPEPKPSPGRDPVEAILAAFNRISPDDVAGATSQEQLKILYKSLQSWLEDLRELLDDEV